MSSFPRARRRHTALAVILATAVLALTGCTPIVSLDAAAGSNAVGCAEISVRLPDTVGGEAQRETDAQATSAWGDPAVILLRCGVPPIGPTTKPCITVNGVDWVLMNDPADKSLVYQTFGRTPATEVIINHVSGVSDTVVLPDLASAIATVKQTQKCLATKDADPASSPTATQTPTPTPSN
ncbi:DUF3515 domain-containing protein [Leifsonia poae]|uniref:DUF3515 domain-containing protein n=1 Tax=Leifsonia poae TaxID=110933 RepID=UPI001CBA8BF2|nr:DUF3515 domain-containing protein [Leifsonia poae]